MSGLLLSDTTHEPRLSSGDCHAFAATISLSPVLLTIYLEEALRHRRSRPQADDNLPLGVEYADDTDFISSSCSYLDDVAGMYGRMVTWQGGN